MKPTSARPTCAASPANGCTNTRRRGHLMCRPCWLAVPEDIRRAVYAAYNPSAGIHQNTEWLAAANAAIASLRPAET